MAEYYRQPLLRIWFTLPETLRVTKSELLVMEHSTRTLYLVLCKYPPQQKPKAKLSFVDT